MKDALIIDAVRTPRAKKKGKFASVHAVDLLTYPLKAIIERNNIPLELIEDVVTGCVTQVNDQAWCVARAAVLAAGWPVSIPGVTVNRLCGSGLQACNFVASSILAGTYDLAIAGGLEHMTRVPMFSDCSGKEVSPMLKKHHPDLTDQGLAAELLADHFSISREEIDEYALLSQKRAHQAQIEGYFKNSLIPVPYLDEEGNSQTLSSDDNLRPETTIDVLNNLKSVFKENGKVTAGNASAIVDGAAAVLMISEKKSHELNIIPRARIVASSVIGSDPKIMLSGPIEASRQVLKKAGLKKDDISLWEINEAFAPVVLATINELDLNPEIVNVNGGGISLGHPLGATGAMLLGTALDELERREQQYALITMCIGLGMGIATVIERL